MRSNVGLEVGALVISFVTSSSVVVGEVAVVNSLSFSKNRLLLGNSSSCTWKACGGDGGVQSPW